MTYSSSIRTLISCLLNNEGEEKWAYMCSIPLYHYVLAKLHVLKQGPLDEA